MYEVQELLEFLMNPIDQLQVLIVGLLAILILTFILPRLAFFFYERSSSNATQDILREIIYNLDRLADTMSNKEKKDECIERMQQILSFRGLKVPKVIIGWIIDMEVREIRQLQKECHKESDLHKDDED